MFRFTSTRPEDGIDYLYAVVTERIDADPELKTEEDVKEILESPDFQYECSKAYLEDKAGELKYCPADSKPDRNDPTGAPEYWEEVFRFFGVTNKDYFLEKSLAENNGHSLTVLDYLQNLLRELMDYRNYDKIEDFFDAFCPVCVDDFEETYNLQDFEHLNDMEVDIPYDGYVVVTTDANGFYETGYYSFFDKHDAELFAKECPDGPCKIFSAKEFDDKYCYKPEDIQVDADEDPNLDCDAIAKDGTHLQEWEWNDTIGAYVHLFME